MAASSSDVPADAEIGRIIDGRYRIVEILGEGGMGAVYRAEHVGMGKSMAVKLLHPHVSSRHDAGARFRREAFAAGRLDHPNCVAVSDFGVREDGSFYLVMELLQGQSLRQLLERGRRMPWQRALHIARHVLRGLAHAHAQGIVHRDIKPENIFVVRREDDPDFAKILDFGIAKLIAAADSTRVTKEGLVVGTPAYLSPEQAFGADVTPASDVYSLSIVLYEMLAGRPPFSEDEPVALLTAHATAKVPRLADLVPGIDVPESVEQLVRAGLAKRRAERILSADDYIAMIDRVRDELEPGRPRTSTNWTAVPVVEPPKTPLPSRDAATAEVSEVPAPVEGAPDASGAIAGGGAAEDPTSGAVEHARDSAWSDEPASGSHADLLHVATPLPFAATNLTPRPPELMSLTSSDPLIAVTLPAPRPRRRLRTAITVVGIILFIGVVAAVSRTGANAPRFPAVRGAGATHGGTPLEPGAAREAELKAALYDLQNGKTCPERHAAVLRLRALGDAGAVPALKQAVTGAARADNACLISDAEATLGILTPAH